MNLQVDKEINEMKALPKKINTYKGPNLNWVYIAREVQPDIS